MTKLRYIILLLAMFFLQPGSFSQVVTISEPVNLRSDLSYHILGSLKGNLLIFHNRATNFSVQGFDQSLRLSWSKELEFDRNRSDVLDIISTDTSFSVFYQFRNRGSTIIKVHTYDPAANLVDSATVKDLGPLFFTPKYAVYPSEDKSKVLLFDIERQSRIKAMMFDLRRLELMWESEFEPDDFYANRDFRRTLVDNDGNMVLVLEKENRRSRMDAHHFEFFYFGPDTDNMLQRFILPVPDILTFDVFFDFDNLNNKVVGGGLFSDEGLTRAAGFYYLTVDPDQPDQSLLAYHPFRDETITALLGKEVSDNKGIPEIKVREFVLRMDGGIILVTERARIYERQSAALARNSFDRFSHFIVDYYIDDLFVTSIHPTGEVHWENVLHKKQFSQDDGAVFSSYFLMKTPAALRLLFNDEIKNENTVSEYLLFPQGQFDRNSIFSTENQDLKLRFRDALQVSHNEMLVPSERRNRLRMVRITF